MVLYPIPEEKLPDHPHPHSVEVSSIALSVPLVGGHGGRLSDWRATLAGRGALIDLEDFQCTHLWTRMCLIFSLVTFFICLIAMIVTVVIYFVSNLGYSSACAGSSCNPYLEGFGGASGTLGLLILILCCLDTTKCGRR